MTTRRPQHTLTLTALAALTLTSLTHAQNVPVTTVRTAHGMGVGIGVSWVGVRCRSGTPKFQLPTNNPTPHTSGVNNPTAVSFIVSHNQIVRIVRKAEVNLNLNPLEVEFTCVNKQVKVLAGKYIKLQQK